MALGENVFAVAFNACRFVYFKTVAKVLYQKGFDKKTIHKIKVKSMCVSRSYFQLYVTIFCTKPWHKRIFTTIWARACD